MSPAQGRASLAGTRALTSVRVAALYLTTFRGRGPALSCPFIPRVFSAPEMLARQAQAGAQPPHRGEPDGRQRRAACRPDAAAERGRPRGTGQWLGPRLSSPSARRGQPKPKRPPRQAPRAAWLLGEGVVRGLREPTGGFPAPARSPGICGRLLGRQGPCATLGRTWPPSWTLPHFSLSTPKGCIPRPPAHRRSFAKALQGVLGPPDTEVTEVNLSTSPRLGVTAEAQVSGHKGH